MAESRDGLSERLLSYFKGVPNYDIEDAQEKITEAMLVHDLSPAERIPAEDQKLIMLYAQMESAFAIAFSTAHYFRYSDGEEEVDKSKVSDNYRKLAKDLKEMYERENYKKTGSSFRIMRRVDRP